MANGVSSDDSNEIVSWIFNEIRGGGEYSDLMQTSLVPGTENLYAVPKSGLGENPVLIKEGVVEFMKYRAPEYAVESIYAKLSKDGSDIQRDLENAKQDSELSDARDTFADSEGELSKKSFIHIITIMNIRNKILQRRMLKTLFNMQMIVSRSIRM